MRSFLGLPKHVASYGLISEFNWLLPQFQTQIRMIQYFGRFFTGRHRSHVKEGVIYAYPYLSVTVERLMHKCQLSHGTKLGNINPQWATTNSTFKLIAIEIDLTLLLTQGQLGCVIHLPSICDDLLHVKKKFVTSTVQYLELRYDVCLFVCLFVNVVGRWLLHYWVSPRTYPTSKTGPRWGPGRPALMASRLETTRSLECQPPTSLRWP